MALRRLDLLVRDAQMQSGNSKYTATAGVRMAEWQRYANEAQETILNKILQQKSTLYTRRTTINVVAGTAEYDIPSTEPNAVHSLGNIIGVKYSFDGNSQNYVPLEMRSSRQEISTQAMPTSYFLRDGKIVLSPTPNQSATSGLRVDFQYTLPTLDIRRGLISGHSSTDIELRNNSTILTETEDDLEDGYVDYISVVDKDGIIVASGIPVTSYNRTTKVITCTLTGAQVSAIVDDSDGFNWVVFGKYATTHSQLIPICERYVTHYMATLVQMRDSNSEATLTGGLLSQIEQEILDSVRDLEEDLTAIPILDYSYLSYADDL